MHLCVPSTAPSCARCTRSSGHSAHQSGIRRPLLLGRRDVLKGQSWNHGDGIDGTDTGSPRVNRDGGAIFDPNDVSKSHSNEKRYTGPVSPFMSWPICILCVSSCRICWLGTQVIVIVNIADMALIVRPSGHLPETHRMDGDQKPWYMDGLTHLASWCENTGLSFVSSKIRLFSWESLFWIL